ncbi:MAG: zinc-binding dehydrogenase [Rhodospirillales bacterium]|nr:zinc-binding dehydrogenase [Rhodospirillales bacterium]
MKSVIFREAGGPEVLELVEAPEPVAGPGQIVIRTRAMGVSVPDLLIRKGVYKWSPPLPANPGNELAGTVVTVGEGVSEFGPGQPVLLSARELPQRGGCYTELIAVPVSAVHALSEGVDFERAVVLPTYVVAHAMLLGFGISKNARSIFVTGAAGAIATALTDLAKAEGISVIGSVSTEAKAAYARARGVDDVVYYKSEALLDRVMELTDGRGVDVVIDPVGGPIFDATLPALATGSRVVTAGGPAGARSDLDQAALGARGQSVQQVGVFNDAAEDTEQAGWAQLKAWFEDGTIRPVVDRVLPWTQAEDAQRLLAERAVFGKVVLTVEG